MKVREITEGLERLAPPALAESWDNSGLTVGDPDAEVNRIVVTLDVTEDTLDYAAAMGAELIVAHHPLIFGKLAAVRADDPVGRLVMKAVGSSIAVYGMHTNLDNAPGGMNDELADRLGMMDRRPLVPLRGAYKVAVTVPDEHAEAVMNAMFDAGAGKMGHYDRCAFKMEGEGTFRPLDGAHPFVGQRETTARVPEEKLEALVDQAHLDGVLAALAKAHPYEHPAVDVIELFRQRTDLGTGRVGRIVPIRGEEFLPWLKEKLDLAFVRVCGTLPKWVEKVAVLGGSGAAYISEAACSGADVYVTGDMKHHDALLAKELGLPVVDAGHYGLEKHGVHWLIRGLQNTLNELQYKQIEILVDAVGMDPFYLG